MNMYYTLITLLSPPEIASEYVDVVGLVAALRRNPAGP